MAATISSRLCSSFAFAAGVDPGVGCVPAGLSASFLAGSFFSAPVFSCLAALAGNSLPVIPTVNPIAIMPAPNKPATRLAFVFISFLTHIHFDFLLSRRLHAYTFVLSYCSISVEPHFHVRPFLQLH